MPSRAQYQGYRTLPQVRAALDTIAWAEGGRSYNTLYGGGVFSGNQHPNRVIRAGGYPSTAAGRYQFLYRTWIEIKNRLGLPDFGPESQDIAAIDLISQRGQLGRLLSGDFEGMTRGLGCAWAALPFSGCGQRERGLAETMNYYRAALAVYGGTSAVSAHLPMPSGIVGDTSPTTIAVLAVAGIALLFLITE